jgi:FkbM family methyltransferase
MRLLNNFKNAAKVLLGKRLKLRSFNQPGTVWYGNKYAGFFVEPSKLNSESIIYSFGVGEDVSFDEQLINNFDCKVFAFDPTPKSIEFIKSRKLKNFTFLPYGLHKQDGFISFFLPLNKNHVSGSTVNRWQGSSTLNKLDVPVKCFSTIIDELKHKQVNILKMDIEGSEYEVLDSILNSSVYIDQILIEFHHRFSHIKAHKTKEALKKLEQNGYVLIGVSETQEEFTFIKSA